MSKILPRPSVSPNVSKHQGRRGHDGLLQSDACNACVRRNIVRQPHPREKPPSLFPILSAVHEESDLGAARRQRQDRAVFAWARPAGKTRQPAWSGPKSTGTRGSPLAPMMDDNGMTSLLKQVTFKSTAAHVLGNRRRTPGYVAGQHRSTHKRGTVGLIKTPFNCSASIANVA